MADNNTLDLDNVEELPEEGTKTIWGTIKPRKIEVEMQESYLDYAMSVIVQRALPDVRDGMKPVHRRVMYAMWDTGLRANSKFRKCAAVVGEVLKSYHPHGDVAVYDTLVRMAQDFSMRYPLVHGQGNFGSMDGDSAAAMRYTESKMAAIAEEMMFDIEKDTVNFIDNYDGSTKEPTVLPAKLPNLLLNGSMGIAVGMMTNIPPHNLTELVDGITHLIDNPEATTEDLMEFVKGPDFPTAANIYNIEDIKQAYSTGKGRIVVRATANIEEHKNSFRIIVTELPYQVNKADLISKIADLVKDKKIEGVSDLRDESDRTAGVRIVIELKSNAYPKKILNRLYELTAMQTAFHVNLLALVDGIQPRVLTLKNILEEYIKHRQEVVTRRTQYELKKAQDRAHVLEGLLTALDHIDDVITTIRSSQTREIAHKNLCEKYKLTEIQASAILEMRLSALAGLERQRVKDEYDEKQKLIAELEAILADPARILQIIKDEIKALKEKFGDERRTKVFQNPVGEFSAADLIPNEQEIVTITKGNYIKRVPASTYKSQVRGGKGVMGMTTKEEDVVEYMLSASTHDDIFFFTNKGRIFQTKVYELPASSRQAKGQALVNVIQISQDETVTAVITMNEEVKKTAKYFVMATTQGVIKKTEIEAYKNVRKTGILAIKLNDKDELRWVCTTEGDDNVFQITSKGQAIMYNENDIRPMGRSAAGVRGIKLRTNDHVVSTDIVTKIEMEKIDKKHPAPDILVVLENGLGKRTSIEHFRAQIRGGMGMKAANVTDRTGEVIGAQITFGDKADVIMVSQQGQLIRLGLSTVKRLGRDTQGVTLMKLNNNDLVSSVTVVYEDENTESDPTPAPQLPIE